MSPHQDMMEKSRHTRQAMYLVATIYVGAGFYVAIPAANSGDTLVAFLGFMVISGVLAVAVVVNSLLQVSARVGAMEEKLDALGAIQESIHQTVRTPTTGTTAVQFVPESDPEIVDLADGSAEDPSSLAAATMDQEVFPRLVAAIEEPVSKNAFHLEAVETREHDALESIAEDIADHNGHGRNGTSAPSVKETMQLWVAARGAGDLSACRAIINSMPESADPDLVETMHEQLDELNETARHSLREKFAQHVRAGEIAGAIEIGERLRELFPDSDLAEEFVQLKPLLEKRVDSHSMQM